MHRTDKKKMTKNNSDLRADVNLSHFFPLQKKRNKIKCTSLSFSSKEHPNHSIVNVQVLALGVDPKICN